MIYYHNIRQIEIFIVTFEGKYEPQDYQLFAQLSIVIKIVVCVVFCWFSFPWSKEIENRSKAVENIGIKLEKNYSVWSTKLILW